MKKFLLSLLLLIFVILSCKDAGGVNEPVITGEVLKDTTINVSQKDVVVTLKEGISVTVPKGLSQTDFKLTIRAVDNPPITPTTMSVKKSFDVKVSLGEEFDKNLKIRISIDKSSIPTNASSTDYAMGFYNEKEKKWSVFPTHTVNLTQGYVECETNHLTTVGFLEFVTSGGYPLKFVGNGVTVYYTSSSSANAPMSNSEYSPSNQTWHLKPEDKNYAPLYIQDIAYYIAEARKKFAASPHNLTVAKGNINIYVKDMKGVDGEYGSVSGAIYINNTMKLPANVSGIEYEDVLKATCAHELLHLIQDNYYVMNKGTVGMWWLEATATQADRMIWGNSLNYAESELFSIESNSALLETISKSWDDSNKDPNWYLAGCFLHYMANYRDGTKLNIANAIKRGGANRLSLMRVILNEQIQSELNSNLTDEFNDYILYLFTEGNEKLTAFPYNNDYNAIETSAALTKQAKMSKKEHTQTITATLPYLSAKIISVSNLENTNLMINYEFLERGAGIEAYLCSVDKIAGKLKFIEALYEKKTGSLDLKGRVGGDYDSFVILLVNTNFTTGSKDAKFTFKVGEDFKDFNYIRFTLEGGDGDIKFDNGMQDNQWEIGYAGYYSNPADNPQKVISKSFSNNKIKLVFEKKEDWKDVYKNFTSKVTVDGDYNNGEFIILKLKEEITKYKEEWSEVKREWVDHKYTETKELEFEKIPFYINEDAFKLYGSVYSYISKNKDEAKSKLKKLSHKVVENDNEGKFVREYNLLPINWNAVSSYFNISMLTRK